MKSLFIAAILSFFAVTTFAQKHDSTHHKKDTVVTAKYTCPMDTEVISDTPGTCPKCGMALVEKKMYTCPMHPEVVSDSTGICPKCKMDLVEKNPANKEKKPGGK